MEPKYNPNDRPSATQFGEIFDRIVEFIAEAPTLLAYGWKTYRRPIVNVAIVLAGLSAIVAIFDFLESVDRLFFFPTLFTVLGIVQGLRFAYRNVLFAKDRQKLLQQLGAVKQELIGSSSLPLLESNRAIEVKAIAVEEPVTLEAIVQPPEVVAPVEEDIIVEPEVFEEPVVEPELVIEAVEFEEIEPEPVIEAVEFEESQPEAIEESIASEPVVEAEVEKIEPEAVVEEAEIQEPEPIAVETETSQPEPTIEPEAVEESIASEPVVEAAEVEKIEPEAVVEEAEIQEPEPIAVETETSQPEPTIEPEAVEESIASEPVVEAAEVEKIEPEPVVEAVEVEAVESSTKPMGFQKKTPNKSPKKSGDKTEEVVRENTPLETTKIASSIAPSPESLDDLLFSTNGVDELRYLFLSSQVELLDSPEKLEGLTYSQKSETFGIGVVNAEGTKCERCWNYSTFVGKSSEHPTLCDRCIAALNGKF